MKRPRRLFGRFLRRALRWLYKALPANVGPGSRTDESMSLVFGQYALLQKQLPADVNVLKVDIPSDATIETPWQMTRVSRQRYYEPIAPERPSWGEPGLLSYKEAGQLDGEPEDTDVYAMRKLRIVSVSPLSLDLSSRVDLAELEKSMREE